MIKASTGTEQIDTPLETQNSHSLSFIIPTLWVSSLLVARQYLNNFFQLAEYKGKIDQINPGNHFILAEKGTPEALIKGLAWKIQQAGGECLVYGINNSLQNLVGEITAAKELTLQIIEFAQPYEQWSTRNDEHSLSLREAAAVARCAIALLSESEKLIELGILRERCNLSSYEWSKLVKNLELEFQQELERRQGKQPTDKSERLKLELQAMLLEPDLIKRTLKRSEICGKFSISGKDLDILLNAISAANNTPKARGYSAAEFRALEPEGISWVIPGLLPKGGLTMFVGAAGTGKTTLAYDVAGSVLFGDEILGERPTTTGKVLFVASDEPQCFVEDKFINRGIYGSDDYEILLDWDMSQMDALESRIENLRPSLVIIDSFSGIHKDPTFDENSAQARQSIEKIQALVNRYNASALLIHHTAKSLERSGVGKVRGSSALAAAASAVWILDGEKGSEIRTFTTPKIRGAAPWNVRLTLDAHNGRWEIVSGNEEENTHKTIGDRILEFMLTCPETKFEVEEIVEAVGYGKQSVYKSLDRLVQRGILIKRPSQYDARRKVYKLANSSFTPPSPTTRLKVSNKISETTTVYDLEDSRQIVDNYSTDSRQPTDELSTKLGETIDVHESQEIVDNPDFKGGGGTEQLLEEKISVSSLSPTLPTHDLAVGDKVEVVSDRKYKGKKLVISTVDDSGIWLREQKSHTAGFTPTYGAFQPEQLRKC